MDLMPSDAIVTPPTHAELVEHSRRISDAWGAGHDLAGTLHGDSGPGFFTGDRGNRLIFALEALPVGTDADAFHALVKAHLDPPK